MFWNKKPKQDKIIPSDKELTDAFAEANKNLLNSLSGFQTLNAAVKDIDTDISSLSQSIVLLSQAIAKLDERLRVVEDQLVMPKVKFTNN
ncbi:MAG: hypothetical protein WC523_04270 [Patescibacteria group bacterium]